jgi:hypothetical protein
VPKIDRFGVATIGSVTTGHASAILPDGEPMHGVEHPADGTMSPPVSNEAPATEEAPATVTVAEQKAAGVPPEETVTVADQKAGVTPPVPPPPPPAAKAATPPASPKKPGNGDG